MSDPIFVTRPFLPPLADYVALLERIWDSRVLTNGGPFHRELEGRLAAYLDVAQVSLTTNGALALEIAIDAAELSGEVITTPYSFVATTHSVRRGQLKPVFVDILPDDFNIDPAAIRRAITPATSAIVAVHCYGNPCAVDAIEQIAREHDLKVIYDAAHAFGVRLNGRSVFEWGDLSTLSFHATKSYNTFEGGAIVSPRTTYKATIDVIKNFGIASETDIPLVGTNAKMSELNAALGHLQLDHYEAVRAGREAVDRHYRSRLGDVAGIHVLPIPPGVAPNFSYFPLLVLPDFPIDRDALYEQLKAAGIMSRRYFFPLLSSLPAYAALPSAHPDNLPVATRVVQQVLCLPIYPDLAPADIDRIVDVIATAAKA
jgi:dTDP-4-amino-4,6-dideoxygalactose transaminase